jgi:magnesium-transporting ATPase (P-type)
VEALGRDDVLCFDKTGTLTEGRIRLTTVSDGHSSWPVAGLDDRCRAVLRAGLRATPEASPGHPLAHLTDRAVDDAAAAAGVRRLEPPDSWQPVAVLPFDSARSFHAALADVAGQDVLSVKGAPESVLPRCVRWAGPAGTVALDRRRRRMLATTLDRLGRKGLRVLAVAERAGTRNRPLDDDDVQGLTFLGFLALTDPVRGAAGASLTELRAAGVQLVMITGDHPSTAAAIAGELEVLERGRAVLTGPAIDELDDAALDEVLPTVSVVARATPAHKLRVVQAFQRLGRTVAMTGDGANDAPAIRLADVGIALGQRGTPAARAAADVVVTDDRLETITAALVEGRAMWASVRDALSILVGGNLGEIAFTVLGAALTGRSPLTARQLLLVNLLTDLAPATAVAVRPPDPAARESLLHEGPEASLGRALTAEIALRAWATTAGATAAWLLGRMTGRETRARTIALAALVGTQLAQTLWFGGANLPVVASSVGSAAALAAVVQTPGVSQFFGCTPLGPLGWGIAGGCAAGATLSNLVLAPIAARLNGIQLEET